VARVDYDSEAERYHAGRGLPLDHLDGWRRAIGPYFARTPVPVLDVGAGTGIWSNAFVTWFSAHVVAVEPSAGMREVALAGGRRPGLSMVGGRGEAIPLRDQSVGVAWMSTVIHHIDDLDAAAAELARVLRAGGALLIRNSFPFRHEEIMLFTYFPPAKRVAEGFPTVERATDAFTRAGLELEGLRRVREPAPPSLSAFRRWAVSMRLTDSALVPLTDDEFAAGLRSIEAADDRGDDPLPLGLDLLVFTKPA
jgi:ubiquinone/menaquinone biosynthesis C-methylase UbiE